VRNAGPSAASNSGPIFVPLLFRVRVMLGISGGVHRRFMHAVAGPRE